jgi:hypothetical protein
LQHAAKKALLGITAYSFNKYTITSEFLGHFYFIAQNRFFITTYY